MKWNIYNGKCQSAVFKQLIYGFNFKIILFQTDIINYDTSDKCFNFNHRFRNKVYKFYLPSNLLISASMHCV